MTVRWGLLETKKVAREHEVHPCTLTRDGRKWADPTFTRPSLNKIARADLLPASQATTTVVIGNDPFDLEPTTSDIARTNHAIHSCDLPTNRSRDFRKVWEWLEALIARAPRAARGMVRRVR